MLIRQALKKADEKGFGIHLPFSYLSQSYSVEIKAINSFDVFKPIEHIFSAQSYQTMAEVIAQIL